MKLLSFVFLGSATLVACGGKGGAKAPVASGDPCAAGVQASGVTGRAATWDAVGVAVGADSPEALCASSPCGPDEAVSFAGMSGLAIKVDGGYTVIGDAWDGLQGSPPLAVERLGDLLHVSLDLEELGREEVTLDDGSETSATVLIGHGYADYVLDPASGKVLWRAFCRVDGDAESRLPKVTRDGALFSYTGCAGDAPAVRFTAEQASACPAR